MAELCGIVGIGQTKHQAARKDVSMAGMIREAARARARRRRAHLEGHRRRRDRQGARHVRGRDDAGAVPARRDRRRLQADAARAHGGQRRRIDRHRRGEPGAGGHPRPRADGRVREAVREQRDVGALDLAALQRRGGGGRGRLLRAAGARLHAPLGRAGRHRHPRGAEGPQERAEESERAPPDPRHRLRQDRVVADAVGPDPLPRDVSVVGRRLRDGDGEGVAGRAARRASPPGSTPPRCAASRRCSRAATR